MKRSQSIVWFGSGSAEVRNRPACLNERGTGESEPHESISIDCLAFRAVFRFHLSAACESKAREEESPATRVSGFGSLFLPQHSTLALRRRAASLSSGLDERYENEANPPKTR